MSVPFDLGGIIGGILAGYVVDRTGASAITCVIMLLLAIPSVCFLLSPLPETTIPLSDFFLAAVPLLTLRSYIQPDEYSTSSDCGYLREWALCLDNHCCLCRTGNKGQVEPISGHGYCHYRRYRIFRCRRWAFLCRSCLWLRLDECLLHGHAIWCLSVALLVAHCQARIGSNSQPTHLDGRRLRDCRPFVYSPSTIDYACLFIPLTILLYDTVSFICKLI